MAHLVYISKPSLLVVRFVVNHLTKRKLNIFPFSVVPTLVLYLATNSIHPKEADGSDLESHEALVPSWVIRGLLGKEDLRTNDHSTAVCNEYAGCNSELLRVAGNICHRQ